MIRKIRKYYSTVHIIIVKAQLLASYNDANNSGATDYAYYIRIILYLVECSSSNPNKASNAINASNASNP